MKMFMALPLVTALLGGAHSALAQPVGVYRGPMVIVIEQSPSARFCCSAQCGVRGYRRGVFQGQSSISADLYFDRVMPVLERIERNCGGSSHAYAAANIRMAGDQVSLLRGAGFAGTLLDDTENFASSAIAGLGDEDALEALTTRHELLLNGFAAAFRSDPAPAFSSDFITRLGETWQRQAAQHAIQEALAAANQSVVPDVYTDQTVAPDGTVVESMEVTKQADGSLEIFETYDHNGERIETFTQIGPDGDLEISSQTMIDGEVVRTETLTLSEGVLETRASTYEDGVERLRELSTIEANLIEWSDFGELDVLESTLDKREGAITFNADGGITQTDTWTVTDEGASVEHERTIYEFGQPKLGVTAHTTTADASADYHYWSNEDFGFVEHHESVAPDGLPEISTTTVTTEVGELKIYREFSDGRPRYERVYGAVEGTLDHVSSPAGEYDQIVINGEEFELSGNIDALGDMFIE